MESAVKMQVTYTWYCVCIYSATDRWLTEAAITLLTKMSTWEEQDKNISRAPVSALTYCQIHSHCIGVEWKKNSFMYKNTVWFAVCMFSTSIELLFIWLIKTKARCRMNPSMESTATQICFRRRVEHTYFFWLLMFPCLHLKILT